MKNRLNSLAVQVKVAIEDLKQKISLNHGPNQNTRRLQNRQLKHFMWARVLVQLHQDLGGQVNHNGINQHSVKETACVLIAMVLKPIGPMNVQYTRHYRPDGKEFKTVVTNVWSAVMRRAHAELIDTVFTVEKQEDITEVYAETVP